MNRTFIAWMNETLEKDYWMDLHTHGAAGGFPGLTYYTDTLTLYDEFEGEIWDALRVDAQELGFKNVFELIATFNGAHNMEEDQGFKNGLVWYMAERVAANWAYLHENDTDEEAQA